MSESSSPQLAVSCAHTAGVGFTSLGPACLGADTHPTQLAQRVSAVVTQVLRARVGTSGFDLAQGELLDRDAFCLHVLLLMFFTPFVYQRPSRCPAGYAGAFSVVFTHCSEPFSVCSSIC